MPTNNFKLFDENKANLLSDTEYANATQRLNGVQTGVASSQLNNKFAYQVSLVAYAIAQIMNQNNLDASDTLAVSAFVGNLGSALLQKVADKASSTEAAAGVLNNKYITPATMKAAALLLSGGTLTGNLDMNGNKILNLPTPTSSTEPATKGYVDNINDNIFDKFSIDKEISVVAYSSNTLVGTGTLKNVNCGCIVKINNTVSNSTVARIYKNGGSNKKGGTIIPAVSIHNNEFMVNFYNDDKNDNYIPRVGEGGITYSAYYLRTFSLYIPFWCN